MEDDFCIEVQCPPEDDYAVYGLQNTFETPQYGGVDIVVPNETQQYPPFVPVIPETDCILLECAPDDDYGVYQLQDREGPPAKNAFNDAVMYCCPEGLTLTFTGTLPNWISLDSDTGCLVGAAGTFREVTKAEANADAQNALDAFIAEATAAGDLTCSSSDICTDGIADLLTNLYQLVPYADGDIDNVYGGAPGVLPVWDGTFNKYFNGGIGFEGWVANNIVTYQMDSKSLCNAMLTYVCAGSVPTWTILVGDPDDVLQTDWLGTKVGGQTPEGVYNKTGGDSVGPATLTIALVAGAATLLVGATGCAS